MSSKYDPFSNYFFDETAESEVSRLDTQYPFVKSVVGHPQVIPPGIDIAHVSRVIDVGTGSGAWALDFVSQPEVRRSNIEVFACDISDTKFPQRNLPEVAEAKRITFFQQDVTKPFPDELLGTFDLVNLRLLTYALTSQGWELALQNLHSLLRPGGHVIVLEGDLIMYNHEHPPPPDGQKPDATAYMQGTSIAANVNRIVVGGAMQRGFIVGISYRFPNMFEAASLRVLSSRRVKMPFGHYCDSYTGIDGTCLSKYTAFSIENYIQLFNKMTKALMKNGDFELANGKVVSSEEERQALMEDIARFLTEGGFMFVSEWVVERPFES